MEKLNNIQSLLGEIAGFREWSFTDHGHCNGIPPVSSHFLEGKGRIHL